MPGEDACTLQVLRDGELQTIPITGMKLGPHCPTHRQAYYIFPDLMPDDRHQALSQVLLCWGLVKA